MNNFPHLPQPLVKPLYKSSNNTKCSINGVIIDNKKINRYLITSKDISLSSETKCKFSFLSNYLKGTAKRNGKACKLWKKNTSVLPFDARLKSTGEYCCGSDFTVAMEDNNDSCSLHLTSAQDTRIHINDTSTITTSADQYLDAEDYIDDTVRCPSPKINKYEIDNNSGGHHVTDSDVIRTPKKPPRHVKLKKLQNNLLRQNSHLDGIVINDDPKLISYSGISGQGQGEQQNVNRGAVGDLKTTSEECCDRNYRNKYVSIGIQASPFGPYRLKVLPKCGNSTSRRRTDETSTAAVDNCLFCPTIASCCGVFGRWILSQCGLGLALFIWALLGAAAFRFTEGPREEEQASQLRSVRNDLVIELATELRQVKEEDPVWRTIIRKYIIKHESLLLGAVGSGYGEGGVVGHIWTYPGCILFAVSLLTTLGFGAPVPRTTLGRGAAVIFAAIGIPLHLLLVLNIGMVLARKLQRHATGSRNNLETSFGDGETKRSGNFPAVAKWLTWLPFVAIVGYYVLGVVVFGVTRQRQFESFLFPLDFTAAGGLATTQGYTRICYALYLEFAVILAGITVSLLQGSATSKFTEIGLKLGILTNK